jgi:hypothetical protein
MLKGGSETMMHFDPAGGSLRKRKKSASPGSNRPANGTAKNSVPQAREHVETELSSFEPVGGIERTRRLFQAAMKLWELKRRSRD